MLHSVQSNSDKNAAKNLSANLEAASDPEGEIRFQATNYFYEGESSYEKRH
jgi:hypothetical protein